MFDRTESPARRRVLGRLAVAAVSTVLLLLVVELALRALYFQHRSSHPLALVGAAQSIALKKAVRQGRAEDRELAGAWPLLFSVAGDELRLELMARYREHFAALVSCVRRSNARMLVLYLPMSPPASSMAVSEPFCRPFFRAVATEHQVAFLDLAETLYGHDWNAVSLRPHDGHLSRFGNRVVARELAAELVQHRAYRSGREAQLSAAPCGDLEPSASRLWEVDERMPYRVITNAQGFRNAEELAAHRDRQRVLCLGDSFTFGPFLPNHDSYPAQLAELMPELEVANAGIGGYTITSEASLYCDSAWRSAPDVVVLQVLDNDLYELMSSRATRFDRLGRRFVPSPAEGAFLARLAAGRD